MEKKNVNKSGWSILLAIALWVTLQSGFNYLYAQGNLQFNQVKLVSAIQTVPAGKVWKVESFAGEYQSGSSWTMNCTSDGAIATPGMFVNGIHRPFWPNFGANQTMSLFVMFPMWLPSGTTVRTPCDSWFLSVIEFNIVP